jgi:hypothetical protein
MDFLRGLLAARSHFAFVVGLLLAAAIVWQVGRWERGSEPCSRDFAALLELDGEAPRLRLPGTPLSDEERAWARDAWAYFVRNTDPQTGLTHSAEAYPNASLWDTGSALMALLAARELDLVDDAEFLDRAGRALRSLQQLALVDGALPNKAYDTRTLAPVDYDQRPFPQGIGWSALDLGRIAVPLQVMAWTRPELQPEVRAVVGRWKLERAVADGRPQTSERGADGALRLFAESRFGYEQLAARGLFLLGESAGHALAWSTPFVVREVEGQKVPFAPPDPPGTPSHNALVSEPFLLEAVEYGLDANTLPIAQAVLLAQQRRFERTGRLTAVSEDHVDREPRFVYFGIVDNGRPWRVVGRDGAPAPGMELVSTKAALGWGSLFEGAYADRLRAAAAELHEPGAGFYSGRYEEGGAVNRAMSAKTNGFVLELLAYRLRGPWLRAATGR